MSSPPGLPLSETTSTLGKDYPPAPHTSTTTPLIVPTTTDTSTPPPPPSSTEGSPGSGTTGFVPPPYSNLDNCPTSESSSPTTGARNYGSGDSGTGAKGAGNAGTSPPPVSTTATIFMWSVAQRSREVELLFFLAREARPLMSFLTLDQRSLSTGRPKLFKAPLSLLQFPL